MRAAQHVAHAQNLILCVVAVRRDADEVLSPCDDDVLSCKPVEGLGDACRDAKGDDGAASLRC